MTKPSGKPKATATLHSPHPEVCATVEQTPGQVRAILWKIASDPARGSPGQPGWRPAACC
jgi:hypothetical protein